MGRPGAPPSASLYEDDPLLHPSIFEPDPVPERPAPLPSHAQPAPALKLVVKGLGAIERQLLEGLVKVSQRRTPRLQILEDALACDADVVMIDTRAPEAMLWAHERPWLAERTVIWIDAAEAASGHTVVRRPVQWPVLPMLLARALESAPIRSAAAAPRIAASQPARVRGPAPQVPQILVVDDSLPARAHLRGLLERRGCVVTDAESVQGALQSLKQRAFDCVLMDVLMPDTDGYAGCDQIKARLRGANAVPVVMLSSRASAFDRIRGKMAGCDAFLGKPVEAQHLDEVLAQLLGEAAQQ